MKIGIMISDYKLEFDVIQELKRINRKYNIVEDKSKVDIYDVIISDYFEGEKVIVCHSARECIRRLQSYFYGKEKFTKLVVGIDPGPKPGIAVIGDGTVVEEIQLPSLEGIRKLIDDIYFDYSPEFFIVRIGDGDITNRNRIINYLVDKYSIEIVNEENTSESITNKDIESAKVIAFTRGERVKRKLNIVVTEGYIKDIQRKSRIESGGEITISRDLAKKVALGDISLKEAIKKTRNRE